MYRASTGELGYYDEPPRRGGGERWDREKFDRMSSKRGGRDEHDDFHFEEHDRSGRGRRDIEIDERIDRKGPSVIEREHFHEDVRRESPRRPRSGFYDEPDPLELANRALAPYRRKSIVEKDMNVAIRRPARPNYLRRVSSLDTFDRKPGPRFIERERYVEKERDEWRPPANVPIPLPIRERRRSPSRRRPREDDFEELSYRDLDPRDDFSEIEVIKRRSKSTRRRAKSVSHSVRSSSTSSFEEVEAPKPIGKKGKTRMPKRLVKKQAIIELGYPFEEEEDFIIVRRALEKEQIDEIIKISENYKEERTTYVYEDKKEVAPPPPPRSVVEELRIHHSHPAPPPSHYAQSVRSVSPPRHHEALQERIEQSNHIGGPLTVLVPPERRERVVREVHEDRLARDVRALEDERRMLKYEREREEDFEIIERREPRRDVVRIDRDRRERRRSKPPNPKLVAAMMATLT